MSHLVAPSLLSADFANLQRDIELVNSSQADWFHLDIMDGVFVPNISFGLPVIKAIRRYATKPLDVHLMIIQPERYISQFRDAGADILTVHYEACTHLHRTLTAIKQQGMKAGVVLNPHTPVSHLQDIISETDLVLLMSVNPGYSGQTFIEQTFLRIQLLKDLIARTRSNCLIEVDGGVTIENAGKLVDQGIDILVAGNTIFKSADPKATIRLLKNATGKAVNA